MLIWCFPQLDLHIQKKFFGEIIDIWAATPVELRRRGDDQGWSTVVKLLQKCVCVNCKNAIVDVIVKKKFF